MIPIYQPYIGQREKEYVADCLESTWISSKGEYISRLERLLCNYVNRKYASTCSNGTVALDLAFKALKIGAGDEVITTSFTYVASTNAIINNQATPVFVDIESLSWNIDVDLIVSAITDNTKAILVSNIYGYLPDFEKLERICSEYNLYLIEDAAESLGSSLGSRRSGSFGTISTFSFFGNKTITTGEGGMVLTDSTELHERIELLKNQGNSKILKYHHDTLGYNYRMTNIQAAIGVAQFERIDEILFRKKIIAERYRILLDKSVLFQRSNNLGMISSNWIITVLFKDERILKSVIDSLEHNEIETRPLFPPVDSFAFYPEGKNLINTYDIFKRGLCLPSFPELTESQQVFITGLINKIVKNE